MLQIRAPITLSFEDFDFVVEALHKAAREPRHKGVRNFIQPVFQGLALKTGQATLAHLFHLTFERASPR